MSSNQGGRRGHVELVEGRVVIHDLELTETEVVELAQRYAEATGEPDVTEPVVGAIVVGAKVLEFAGTNLDLERVQRSVDDMATEITTSTEQSLGELRKVIETITDENDGTLINAVTEALTGLEAAIAELTTGDGAPIPEAVREAVVDVTDRTLDEIHRVIKQHNDGLAQTFAPDNPASPLNALRLEMLRTQTENTAELRDHLARIETALDVANAVKNTMKRTAVKGTAYELQVFEVIERIAKGAGDIAVHTGARPGLTGRGKKGDITATLSPLVTGDIEIKLTLEAKDTVQRIDEWQEELDGARKNRGAVAALGVVRSPDQIPGGDRLRVIDPLTILVAFDPATDDTEILEAAYHLLRAQAAFQANVTDEDLDIAAVCRLLSESLGLLKDFDKIKQSAGKARGNVQSIEDAAEKIRGVLTEKLSRARGLLDRDRDAA